MGMIDTGDTVFHKPSGEKWVVACVEGKHLSWCGWPEGTADVNDCELIQKATEEEREELIKQLAKLESPDHRGIYARNRLAKDVTP